MNNQTIKIYPYRWVILALYFLITVIIEIHWLTFASISSAAQTFYGATALKIDFLSMIYMIAFIVIVIAILAYLFFAKENVKIKIGIFAIIIIGLS